MTQINEELVRAPLRALTTEEVTFEVRIEPEDTPVRGNYMETDDPEADKAAEDDIIAALELGETRAWCCVVVEARWHSWTFSASLGCVSLGYAGLDAAAEAAELEELVDSHGMKAEALAGLNTWLREVDSRLSALRPSEKLGVAG